MDVKKKRLLVRTSLGKRRSRTKSEIESSLSTGTKLPLSYWRELVWSAKRRCKKKNIPFDITPEYIYQIAPTHCPIFGCQLVPKYGTYSKGNSPKFAVYNAPSIDRIIPHNGYVQGNIIIVSWRVNYIKSDASVGELEQIIAFYKNLLTFKQ